MDLKTRILKGLNQSFVYRKMAYRFQKWSVERDPMGEILRNYRARFQKDPNLETPRNLIEKIYWMQLHCDTSEWTICADKYRMRNFIEKKGFAENLPTLYGMWEDPYDINWSDLPQQFVIKANNGCGTVLVVKDKSNYNERKIKKLLKNWISIPYGYRGYQPHYLRIKPCIIAEELLIQDKNLDELSVSMVDFKVWCFNGKAESIFVAYDRTNKSLGVDLYDAQWKRLPQYIRSHGIDIVDNGKEFPKPPCLDEMLYIAQKVSEGMPQVRVDFYVIDGKPVIGELTMASGYGYFTEEYYNHLGDLTDLSLMKKIN